MVAVGICFLLQRVIGIKWRDGGSLPSGSDQWFSCFLMEHQITRLLGSNPGGLWEGGYFYPFHKVSLLCQEPTWGISLAVLPFWLVTRDIFLIHNFGGSVFLAAAWAAVYVFARRLGCGHPWAFFAGMTFCLSGVALATIPESYYMWPVFLVPCLGIVLIRLMESGRMRWALLFGAGYGYLAWSSVHLAVMGGCFLAAFGVWMAWRDGFSKVRAPVAATGLALILSAGVYGPMYFVHRAFGRTTVFAEQALYAANPWNWVYTHQQWERPFHFLAGTGLWEHVRASARGEIPIGVPWAVWGVAAVAFVYYLLRSRGRESGRDPLRARAGRGKRAAIYAVPLVLAGVNVAVLGRLLGEGASIQPDGTATFLIYGAAGAVLIRLGRSLAAALRHPPFFFFVFAAFCVVMASGPYWMTGPGRAVPSPLLILMSWMPGLAGIRAVARWGLPAAFALSVGSALALSGLRAGRLKSLAAVGVLAWAFFELFPGFYRQEWPVPVLNQWRPRDVDRLLKDLPRPGAVLELVTYPEGPALGGEMTYSMLYHRRPLVTGHATVTPRVTAEHVQDGRLPTGEEVDRMRAFGARYWVLHARGLDDAEGGRMLPKLWHGLERVAVFDDGRVQVYEDPNPHILVTSPRFEFTYVE